ncbi:MAG: class I SAM-dependent methyltransferase [Planctomycetaceae bacterium]|jgi:2-polyprenyl-3-methyl-5-hydroxy-6-metoxy-1,4-benzoquinol methylase|nr:class I SAM-dependent methyltransferase [Planctomycetaceae bacterium]
MQPNPCLGVTSETKISNSYKNRDWFSWVCYTLLSKKFKYASTMSWAPHWYTLRKQWSDVEAALDPLRVLLYEEVYCDEAAEEQQKRAYAKFETAREHLIEEYEEDDKEFMRIARYIRKYGYNVQFGKTMYRCFDINDMKYWSMGYPIEMTQLINRAYRKSPFDKVSKTYDEKYGTSQCLENDKTFSKLIQDYYKGSGNVLEIGCATGSFSKLYENYTGIDQSQEMVKKAQKKFPHRQFQTASLESFYTEDKYDFVFTTYGTASYFVEGYIDTKLLDHLVLGGRFLLTYPDTEDFSISKIQKTLEYTDLCEKVGDYYVIGGVKKYDN